MEPSTSIEWRAPEYDHFERTPEWFWTIGIVSAVLILASILFKNFLFAIILLLGSFTAMLYAARPPQPLDFALTPKGIRIKDRLYPYDSVHSFWVSDDYHKRKIIIESDRLILPHLIIPLPAEVSDETARTYLLAYLPEQRHEESLADMIADALGF